MKINGAHNTVTEAGGGSPAPEPEGAVGPAIPIDKVTTEEAKHLDVAVSDGIAMATTERAVRLHALAQAVRSGAYRPSASQLADKILDQAELEARLARALG
ncbi:MAG: flagellar biosynthesis anti-sigma factor FlgM [Pseudomonadota bacterium]